MKTPCFALLVPIAAFATVFSPYESLAQEATAEVEVISAVIAQVKQDVPGPSRIALEVRTGDPRMEGSEFDSERSTAVGERRPEVEVASGENVLECEGVLVGGTFPCELQGADVFVSVWRVEGSGSEWEVHLDTREALAEAPGGRLHWKRIVMTVEQRSDDEWVVTQSRIIAES